MWNLDEEFVNAEIAKKLGDIGGDVADKLLVIQKAHQPWNVGRTTCLLLIFCSSSVLNFEQIVRALG
jgi:hypothetical protein